MSFEIDSELTVKHSHRLFRGLTGAQRKLGPKPFQDLKTDHGILKRTFNCKARLEQLLSNNIEMKAGGSSGDLQ